MEKNTKKNIFVGSARLAAMLCFCLALAFVIFPASSGITPASAQTDINSTETARSARQVVPQSTSLIPLGRTTGIKMFSEGAMVVDFSESGNEKSPASAAGIELGDVIVAVNENAVKCNEDLIRLLEGLDKAETVITVRRGEELKNINVVTVYDEAKGVWRLGAWVRDSIAGIGTITFVDPNNGAFGALGHGISDADTGKLMTFENGSIMESTVAGVKKGQPGAPGELTGSFNLMENQGEIHANTEQGIFGRVTDDNVYQGQSAVQIGKKSEIKEGKAYILSNVEGDKVEQFDVEILRVYPGTNDSSRDMMIQITDQRLIGITGGIVQGMSGSPIIQNGKLIGAVTHVLINDPTRGYGISIENMLASAVS